MFTKQDWVQTEIDSSSVFLSKKRCTYRADYQILSIFAQYAVILKTLWQ